MKGFIMLVDGTGLEVLINYNNITFIEKGIYMSKDETTELEGSFINFNNGETVIVQKTRKEMFELFNDI